MWAEGRGGKSGGETEWKALIMGEGGVGQLQGSSRTHSSVNNRKQAQTGLNKGDNSVVLLTEKSREILASGIVGSRCSDSCQSPFSIASPPGSVFLCVGFFS